MHAPLGGIHKPTLASGGVPSPLRTSAASPLPDTPHLESRILRNLDWIWNLGTVRTVYPEALCRGLESVLAPLCTTWVAPGWRHDFVVFFPF